MTKAYSYIRMSTSQQLRGDSLRRQTERAEQFCREHGLDLDTTFKLQDIGFSAFTGDHIENGSLGHFLRAVRAGQIEPGSFLVIEAHDRLSRMVPRRALPVFLDILNAKISIAVLSEGRIFHPESDNQFELIEVLSRMSLSHAESQQKSDRGRRTWAQKRKNMASRILTKLAPGWVTPKADLSGFDLVPPRVEIVKLIFNLAYDSGMGSYSIARELNRRQLRTFGRAVRGWQKSSVQKILNSKAVIGEYEPQRKEGARRISTGQVLSNYFPPIIDPSIFHAVQHKRKTRATVGGGRIGNGVSNLFTKLARCGYCQGPMHMIDRGERGGGKFLVCDYARRSHQCRTATWPYGDFEASVISFVTEINAARLTGELVHTDELAQLRKETDAAKGLLLDLTARRARVFELLTLSTATDHLREQYLQADRQVAEAEANVQALDQRARELRTQNTAFSGGSDDLLKLLGESNPDKQVHAAELRHRLRSAFRDLVDAILVYPLGTVCPVDENTPGVRVMQHGEDLYYVMGHAWYPVKRPRKDARRFMVRFKDGTSRTVKPNFMAPTQFEWIADGDADAISHAQVREMAALWGLDPLDPPAFGEAYQRLRKITATNDLRDWEDLKKRQEK